MEYIDCDDNIINEGQTHFVGWDGETRSTAWLADPLFRYDMGIAPYVQGAQLEPHKVAEVTVEDGLCEVVWRYKNDQWLLSVEEDKQRAIDNIKERTGEILAKTDWYYIREVSRGIAVPQDVIAQREALSAACDQYEQSIGECGIHRTIHALEAEFLQEYRHDS